MPPAARCEHASVLRWLLLPLLSTACLGVDGDAVDPERNEVPKPTPAADPVEPGSPEPTEPEAASADQDAASGSLEMTFVGDVIFGRFRAGGFDPIPEEGHAVFAEVADLLRADLVVGNLETPVVRALPQESPIGSTYRFGASAEHARHLAQAGFSAVSLANNHAYDLRSAGLEETPEILKELGVVPLGASRREPPPVRVETIEKKGWRVGFLALTTRRNAPQIEGERQLPYLRIRDVTPTLGPRIEQARADHDVLVVLIHWGEEYAEAPSRIQTIVAHELIDAGVDLVVGHHPHVLQAFEHRGGGLVAYSLGNFLFENTQEIPKQTGVLRVRFRANGRCLEQVRFHPAYIKRIPVPHPRPARGWIGHKVRTRLMEQGKPFRMTWDLDGEDLVARWSGCETPPPPPTPRPEPARP
jgi:poly-gamma-glutamate synthesis protein (capsule biosynthesis protein)